MIGQSVDQKSPEISGSLESRGDRRSSERNDKNKNKKRSYIMPKQILVANKSRKTTVKVHFR